MVAEKTLREGSAVKRAAILEAARELFEREGYDRSSVDAVAAKAAVSKRTVYDYFGDKQGLLLAVFEESGRLLMARIASAIDEELTDPVDLEKALIAFAEKVTTTTLDSPDYVAMRRLGEQVASLPDSSDPLTVDDAPEEAVSARFAEFGERGLLDVPDPRLAADHFIALTFVSAFELNRGATSLTAHSRRRIVEGVRAFLRAYAPR